jgi:hypothetical protein
MNIDRKVSNRKTVRQDLKTEKIDREVIKTRGEKDMKIDVSKIPDYESMTAEEKLKALEEYEFDAPAPKDNTDEVTKLKSALSRANSEAADWKRQLREKQTEAERAEAERSEREKAIEDELRTLRKEKEISKLEAQYLAAGYSAELASASAKAQAEGDTAAVLANQMKFIEETKKSLEAAALGKQPTITPGKPPKGESDEDEFFKTFAKYAGLK